MQNWVGVMGIFEFLGQGSRYRTNRVGVKLYKEWNQATVGSSPLGSGMTGQNLTGLVKKEAVMNKTYFDSKRSFAKMETIYLTNKT